MEVKYILHPGQIPSKNDGDYHYITYKMLISLYGLDHRECMSADRIIVGSRVEMSKFTHLYPSYHGKYELTK